MNTFRIITILLIGIALIAAVFLGYWVFDSILAAVMGILANIPLWLLIVGGIGFCLLVFRRR